MNEELAPNFKDQFETCVTRGCGALFKSNMGNILVCGEMRPDNCRFLCEHCLRFYENILIKEKEAKK